jgi:hypothetical protein
MEIWKKAEQLLLTVELNCQMPDVFEIRGAINTRGGVSLGSLLMIKKNINSPAMPITKTSISLKM